MSFFKQKVWRNQKYLDWVKTQPSCISQRPADDAHHMKGHGYGGSVAPDYTAIPLTRDEHTNFHNIGFRDWEDQYQDQRIYAALILFKALDEGVI